MGEALHAPASTVAAVDLAEALQTVHGLDVFRHLPEHVGVELLCGGAHVEFGAGELLIQQGEPSHFALVLIEGAAEILVESKHGPIHLAALSAPALVGEVGVFTMVSRTATIRARTSVRAVVISEQALRRTGRENPGFLAAVLEQLGRRLDTFNKAIGFYAHALAALKRDEFDLTLLDDLMNPLPELADFSRSFRELAEQITWRKAHREEMAAAQAIQKAMLPLLELPGTFRDRLAVHAYMQSAQDVGGDLYDVFPLNSDRLVITIGDVCGKGIPAALFMAMTQTVLRYTLRHEATLDASIASANALLNANNREKMFATLFCGILDARNGALTYCSCGHHCPLIVRSNGRIEELPLSNLPLALKARAQFATGQIAMEAGDRLLLFTDGFSDASNAAGDRFGEGRLQKVVAESVGLSASEIIDNIVHSVNQFAGGASQFDDLTTVLVTLILPRDTSYGGTWPSLHAPQ